MVVINWVNGIWPVNFLPYANRVAEIQQLLHELHKQASVKPRTDCADYCRHIYRELNHEADRTAKDYCDGWGLDFCEAPA
eukprot:5827067-Karenia_brevis.AAC.1